MTFHELTRKIEELSQLHEQFRQLTERRLAEIETKGGVDILTTKNIERLNNQIDHCQNEIDFIKLMANRPPVESSKNTVYEDSRYKTAFCSYLRTGNMTDLDGHKSAAINTSDKNNGYLLTSRMHQLIDESAEADCEMRLLARVDNISTDALELIEDSTPEVAGWSDEISAVLDNPKHSNLGAKKIIPVHDLYAQPKATQKMLDDPRLDVEGWLSERLANVFNAEENNAFIHGNGIGRPRGILTYPENGKESIQRLGTSEAGKITAESLINLLYSIKPKYAKKAKFLMSLQALHQIRLLKGDDGRYLWQPSLSEGSPATVLGIEVVVSADMPAAETKQIPIALGDFKAGYQIVDRQGIKILRDPYTMKPFVKFYSTKRVGGDVVNFEAIKLLQL